MAPFFLLCAAFAESALTKKIPPLSQLNVVIIVVDTLGAAYVGPERSPSLTPQLDRWAEKSIRFTNAVSVAPWTKPALASLLTGKYPINNQVRKLGSVLSDKEETLAELLASQGFSTYGLVSHTLLAPKYGFHQGFELYEVIDPPGSTHKAVTSSLVSDRAIELLRTHAKDKRFFLFAHYFDPHYEYRDHAEYSDSAWYKGRLSPMPSFRALQRLTPTMSADEFRYLSSLYSEEIRYTDHHLGRLLQLLDSETYRDNTLVLFTADHGEEFGEHGGLGHTQTLYQELLHVPLMLKLPGTNEGKTSTRLASQIDILPTILALDAESAPSSAIDGASLIDVAEHPHFLERILFSEVHFGDGKGKLSKLAARQGDNKVVRENFTGEERYYDLSLDSKETHPGKKEDHPSHALLSEALNKFWKLHENRSSQSDKDATHSPEETEKLKSLGYL